MADTVQPTDEERAAARHYLLGFEVDTLRSRPLWIRLIIEFLGTFILVTVAAGAGVINHYAGGNPVSRTAAVIAPGAVVMAMIYAWGPLSGLHINPAVTFGFASRGVFPAGWGGHTGWFSSPGPSVPPGAIPVSTSPAVGQVVPLWVDTPQCIFAVSQDNPKDVHTICPWGKKFPVASGATESETPALPGIDAAHSLIFVDDY